MSRRTSPWLGVLVVACGLAAMLMPVFDQAGAQTQKSIFKGPMQKKGEPVKIQAASLEVRDKEKTATFKGDVVVIQGDTELRCNTLVVFYDGELGGSKGKANPAPSGGREQQIRRMEARGNVVVLQKDQRATGDHAEFDVRNNKVALTGNVVVTRGVDVLRGQRITVDLNTGVSNVEGGSRVEGLFNTSHGQNQDQSKGEGQPRPRRNK